MFFDAMALLLFAGVVVAQWKTRKQNKGVSRLLKSRS